MTTTPVYHRFHPGICRRPGLRVPLRRGFDDRGCSGVRPSTWISEFEPESHRARAHWHPGEGRRARACSPWLGTRCLVGPRHWHTSSGYWAAECKLEAQMSQWRCSIVSPRSASSWSFSVRDHLPPFGVPPARAVTEYLNLWVRVTPRPGPPRAAVGARACSRLTWNRRRAAA